LVTYETGQVVGKMFVPFWVTRLVRVDSVVVVVPTVTKFVLVLVCVAVNDVEYEVVVSVVEIVLV